jgi:error-prone DNA polymerase
VAAGDPGALALIGRFQALGERDDRVLIECQQYPDDHPQDGETLRHVLELAQRSGSRCIATHDVRVLHPDEARIHRLLQAIAHQSSFFADDDRLPPWQQGLSSRYALPDPRTWHQRWDGLPHLIAGSASVLRECQVELLGPKRFPGTSLPPSQIYDQLWSRAFAGLRVRYGQITPVLMQRLYHEIGEVTTQGVAPFLLHAAELVSRAAARGIPMILLGSGTGSLLSFSLGISPVDPARAEGLVFERFAGSHRGAGDLPDLDFAIPAGREAEIHEILVELFGKERVASLAAVVTLKERGAVRAAAEAFGWDRVRIRALRKKVQRGDDLDREERMILRAAEAIRDHPHHLMRHASGVIIADAPLTELYGVGLCADGPLLQANKDDVEALLIWN